MLFDRNTSSTWITTLVVGVVLYTLGGAMTTMAATPRIVMGVSATVIVVLALHIARVARKNDALQRQISRANKSLRQQRLADEALRMRLSFAARDTLTEIVGFADHLTCAPELSKEVREQVLISIRDDAREMESTLDEITRSEHAAVEMPDVNSVVLLDKEVRSIASALAIKPRFVFRLNQPGRGVIARRSVRY